MKTIATQNRQITVLKSGKEWDNENRKRNKIKENIKKSEQFLNRKIIEEVPVAYTPFTPKLKHV
jgi:hypothetical protein